MTASRAPTGFLIGLEVHAYLATEAKLFCTCNARFLGAPPNSQVCPTCTAQPGAKPLRPNQRAVEHALAIALTLACEPRPVLRFLRKHYFYPDLPSNYQRTSEPVGRGGELLGVRLREVHVEEDPGTYDLKKGEVDWNRSGAPLVEIVTDPVLRSPQHAREWMDELRLVLEYLGVLADAGMKADANISTAAEGVGEVEQARGGPRPREAETSADAERPTTKWSRAARGSMEASPRWGERVEIKNLNSSHNVQLALEHELARQRELVASGKQVARETRHFDEARLLTVPLRAKETEEDYRYVPDPDLPTVPLAPLWERSRAVLPEHPHAVRERWVSGLGVTRESCNVLLANRGFVALQEQLARNEDPRLVFDFLVRDVKGELNYRGTGLEASPLKADGLAAILRGLARDKLTRKAAVEVLRGWLDGGTIDDLLARASGTAAGDDVTHAVRAVLEEERDAMAKLRGGKAGAMNFLVGQAMKRLGGKGRPEDVRREVERQLAAET